MVDVAAVIESNRHDSYAIEPYGARATENEGMQHGGYWEFDPAWMDTDNLIFQGRDPARFGRFAGGLEYAFEAMTPHADRMCEAMFMRLQALAEDMESDAARGQDGLPGFDERRQALTALLAACPWQMHPDYGCVRTADIERLDEEAGVAAPSMT